MDHRRQQNLLICRGAIIRVSRPSRSPGAMTSEAVQGAMVGKGCCIPRRGRQRQELKRSRPSLAKFAESIRFRRKSGVEAILGVYAAGQLETKEQAVALESALGNGVEPSGH